MCSVDRFVFITRQRRSRAINNNNKTMKRIHNNEPSVKTKKKKAETTGISIIKQRNALYAIGFRRKSEKIRW